MLTKCGAEEYSWASLGLQADQTSQSPKGNQTWTLFGRTNAEAPKYFGHLMRRAKLVKDSESGEDWEQGEKGAAEDEIAGWHHRLKRHEFEHTPVDSEGQGGLACCSPRGHRVRHDKVTEQQ